MTISALVTGARGFIGTNLIEHLRARKEFNVLSHTRETPPHELARLVARADFVFHLAGVNRAAEPDEFRQGNVDLTESLCNAVASSGRRIPILFASSVHAGRSDAYGSTKARAERLLLRHAERTGAPVHIFRLSQVFGKWCRPNYNSVVATFCYNVARDVPIRIDDAAHPLKLVYIDDVVNAFVRLVSADDARAQYCDVSPVYPTTVGEVAATLRGFRESRQTLRLDDVGAGLARALYATYVSYLEPRDFVYSLARHADGRGEFAEVFKTAAAGQFSYFTARPGATRGGHYHHTKVEKFIVLSGRARFRFRHIRSGEAHEIVVTGGASQVVETVPGWAHDVTNIGEEDLIVMLWASESFDPDHPDTFGARIEE